MDSMMTCFRCRFYEGDDRQGRCIFFPPTVFPMPGKVQGSIVVQSFWPPVTADSRCGHWSGTSDNPAQVGPGAGAWVTPDGEV